AGVTEISRCLVSSTVAPDDQYVSWRPWPNLHRQLQKRANEATGHTIGWRGAASSRLRDGSHVISRAPRSFLGRSGTELTERRRCRGSGRAFFKDAKVAGCEVPSHAKRVFSVVAGRAIE